MKRLFHYTTIEHYKKIEQSKELKPTYFSERLDAAYGEGWYFTDLDTLTDKSFLEKQLWTTNGENKDKCNCYISFEFDDALISAGRKNVFLLPLDKLKDKFLQLKDYTYEDKAIAIRYIGGGHC